MPGNPSAIGFGFQMFGPFPFGLSDWAEEVTWHIIPLFYRDCDASAPGLVAEPLRKWINAVKPLLEELRIKWYLFPSLVDAVTCPLSNLPQLAYTYGVVDDDSRPTVLRRSLIQNTTQLILNKGADKGYQIIGALDNLLVTITPLWSDDCVTGSPTAFHSNGPTSFYPEFDDFPCDTVSCDATFDDFYARWPRRLTWEVPCRTAWLDLYFFSPTDVEIDELENVARRVEASLERTRPIHVRIRNLTYDGPRAVAGGWTIAVDAGTWAVGGGWTIPVTANLYGVGGGWTIPVVATPTP